MRLIPDSCTTVLQAAPTAEFRHRHDAAQLEKWSEYGGKQGTLPLSELCDVTAVIAVLEAKMREAQARRKALPDTEKKEWERGEAQGPGPDLRGLFLEKQNLAGLDLKHADCRGTHFVGANLNYCDLRGAVMKDALFSDSRGWVFVRGGWEKCSGGLKWEKIGTEKPKTGYELSNPELAAALKNDGLEFTREKIDGFGVSDLTCSGYIKVGEEYFKPAEEKEEEEKETPKPASLRGTLLAGTDLSRMFLHGVDFERADMGKTDDFGATNLYESGLQRARLRYVGVKGERTYCNHSV